MADNQGHIIVLWSHVLVVQYRPEQMMRQSLCRQIFALLEAGPNLRQPERAAIWIYRVGETVV